jgi:RIO-like serine/threonine protein kinase
MTSEIVEVRVVVPAELIYLVLEEAVKGDPENLFISNLFNDANWTKMIIESPQTLYLREYSDVIIIISRDINCIYLSFRKKKYNYREVLLKINNILLCL